jgi:predicted PurR-regulated permease PerM
MGLEQYIIALVTFINNIFIPFLLGLAFLFFVINAFRFFIVGGANADSKEKARSLAVYGVLAFVLIIVFWGIVNLLTGSLGLSGQGLPSDTPTSDYIPRDDSWSDCIDGGPC